MNRFVVHTRVGSDGSLHLDIPIGSHEVGTEVQVTVEPLAAAKRTLLASDFLQSGLVGLWAARAAIDDSRQFARRLREQPRPTDTIHDLARH